ncbi:MAG: hypothetical protein JWM20_149 [Patescibacteria group bacterium]|nr:hypothetical protein [Patescibacteria group bacterium]
MEHQQEKELSPWKIGIVIALIGGLIAIVANPIAGIIIFAAGAIMTVRSTI